MTVAMRTSWLLLLANCALGLLVSPGLPQPRHHLLVRHPACAPIMSASARRRKKPPARPGPDVAKNRICCYGCGADLQMDQRWMPGFVEPERYKLKAAHKQLRQVLCERCRSMSQGELLPAVVEGRLKTADGAGLVTPDELRAQLVHLRDRKALVVLLVDLTDVSGSFLPRLRDLIAANPVLLVGTKADLLPRDTKPEAVLDWLGRALSARLAIIGAHLVSAKSGAGVDAATREIMGERKGRDVYVLGAANVGKSAFIAALLDRLHGARMPRLPISSATPGTTLRTIAIDAFSGGSQLYDTPGVHLSHRLTAQLLPSELATISPRGRLRPYTPPLPEGGLPGRTYFWGGVARFDVRRGPTSMRLSFVGFGPSVHGCATADAEAEYAAGVGEALTPPQDAASAAELGPLTLRKQVRLVLSPLRHTADIAISGLGWVAVSALPSLRATSPDEMQTEIDVWVPSKVEVFLRPPMPIGGLPAETAAEF